MDSVSALTCKDLRKQYGQHSVLKGINLSMQANSIHGLVGLNGAGKTTTLECVLGLRDKDAGEISLLGVAPTELHTRQGKVAVVFDSPCLHPQLTVGQSLEYARLHKPQSALPIATVEKLLGIDRYHNFKIRQLSLGNRRRTAIAQALINQPQLVILDEPFNGLDAGGVDDVLNLLKQLNKEQGTSFLLASHQLAYLEKICSHIAILHDGKICLSDTLNSVLAQEQSTITVVTSEQDKAQIVISQLTGVELIKDADGNNLQNEIRCRLQTLSSAELNSALVQQGIPVEQLHLHRPSLESIFYATINGANTNKEAS